MSELRDNPDNVDVVHEESDVNVRAIIRFGIGLLVVRCCHSRVSVVAARRVLERQNERAQTQVYPLAAGQQRPAAARAAVSGKPAAGTAGSSREAEGAARELRLGQQGSGRRAHSHRGSDEAGRRARVAGERGGEMKTTMAGSASRLACPPQGGHYSCC